MYTKIGCILLDKSSKRSLYPGRVHMMHFQLLIELSSIHSQKAIDALESFLVKGCSRKDIYEWYGISPGYFSILLKKIKHVDFTVSQLVPYYSAGKSDSASSCDISWLRGAVI